MITYDIVYKAVTTLACLGMFASLVLWLWVDIGPRQRARFQLVARSTCLLLLLLIILQIWAP